MQDVCLRKRVLIVSSIDNAAFFRRTSFCSNTAGTVGTVRTIGTAGQDICAPEAGRCQTGSGKHCFPVNRKNTALYFVKILRMNYNFIIPHIFFVCKCTNCTKKYCNNCEIRCIQSDAAQFSEILQALRHLDFSVGICYNESGNPVPPQSGAAHGKGGKRLQKFWKQINWMKALKIAAGAVAAILIAEAMACRTQLLPVSSHF